MHILVIPGGFRDDQHILKHLLEQFFADIGRQLTQVQVRRDPFLGGVDEALRSERNVPDIRTQRPENFDAHARRLGTAI